MVQVFSDHHNGLALVCGGASDLYVMDADKPKPSDVKKGLADGIAAINRPGTGAWASGWPTSPAHRHWWTALLLLNQQEHGKRALERLQPQQGELACIVSLDARCNLLFSSGLQSCVELRTYDEERCSDVEDTRLQSCVYWRIYKENGSDAAHRASCR